MTPEDELSKQFAEKMLQTNPEDLEGTDRIVHAEWLECRSTLQDLFNEQAEIQAAMQELQQRAQRNAVSIENEKGAAKRMFRALRMALDDGLVTVKLPDLKEAS